MTPECAQCAAKRAPPRTFCARLRGRGWLTKRPSHAYITEALHDILRLAQAPDDLEIDFSELPALLSYAEGIARSTAATLDYPDAVSVAADQALEEIARELHIDHGESWAQLLSELGQVA